MSSFFMLLGDEALFKKKNMSPTTYRSILLTGYMQQNVPQIGPEFPVLSYRCDISWHCLHILSSFKTGSKWSWLIQLLKWILLQPPNDQAPLKAN